MSPELILTRGMPASGKTQWAKNWVSESPGTRARICRDDLRQALYGLDAPLPRELEEGVTAAERASVRALLKSGRSVVVDAMHLRRSYITEWEKIAQETGAKFSVEERFLEVDLEELLGRDAVRLVRGERSVGEKFIRETALRYAKVEPYESASLGTDSETYIYEPDTSLPSAWMVDIDGTLALMNGRGPFEWHRVEEDSVNIPVAELVKALAKNSIIIFMSGRDEVCRAETDRWLTFHFLDFHDHLIMRSEGDNRKDAIVKLELFREHVEPYYNVLGVVDDRRQVVEAWRAAGLFVAQVAPGEF